MKILFCILSIFFFVVGCSLFEEEEENIPNYAAVVESNTSWSGSFGNRTVDGNGNKTIDLPDEEIVCCCVQKQTENGRLKVSIIPNGESAETTAAYGVVTVCNK